MNMTEEEQKLAEEFIKELREETLAIIEYKKKYGRAPCCVNQALYNNCVCWMDSWC